MAQNPLIDAFELAGQGQVFAHFNSLDEAAKQRLLADASEIDLAEIERLNRTLLKKDVAAANFDGIEPAPYIALPSSGGSAAEWAEAKAVGEAALKAGRVAAFTVAGGQGTRLGYDGPKGTFPVTPVRRKTLFQVFAEKILAAGRRYGKPIHWFIMTSHANHEATEQAFRKAGWFGLSESHVHLFRQGRMPAVDFNGRILLESKEAIAMSPDGHGGSLRALDRSGSLDLMKREGIDTLSYFQVDNPLVRVIDPAFIGFHLKHKSEATTKMVAKAYAEEKVGHLCVHHGRVCVAEYSDLPMSLQKEVDPKTGKLRFLAGSVGIHIFDTAFVRRMASGGDGVALPFHRADKKIPTIDAQGNPVKPEKPNGVKFEMFVFDALPFAGAPVIIETLRGDDFSPVKNAEGVDSPKTCRDDQLRQFARWVIANGGALEVDATGLPKVSFEVSPLFGYDEDSFADAWRRLSGKPAITEGTVLE